jgi:subtilisin family serine protease
MTAVLRRPWLLVCLVMMSVLSPWALAQDAATLRKAEGQARAITAEDAKAQAARSEVSGKTDVLPAVPEPVSVPVPEPAPTAAARPVVPRPTAPSVAQPSLPKALAAPLPDLPASATAPESPVNTALADVPLRELGQLILVVAADTAPPWGAWAQEAQGVLRAQTRLEALGLHLAVMQWPSDALARQAAVALGRQHPELVVDLHGRAYPLQADAANAARHYAAAQVYLGRAASPEAALPIPPRCMAKVGVIDTGLMPRAEQERLSASRVVERRFIGPMDQAASPEHGTAVAAVLAGQPITQGVGRGYRSVAPGIELYQAAVMRQEQGVATTNTLALAMALNWLAQSPVDVINMSLAAPGDRVLALVIDRVLAAGIPVVAAVGPGSSAPALIYPAAYPGVLAVGATDAVRQPFARTLRAPYVALSAPGVEVWLPVPAKGDAGAAGAYHSGSSFAAPWVTGVVAQLKSRGLFKRPADLPAALCAMAWPWAGTPPSGLGCGSVGWAPQKLGS